MDFEENITSNDTDLLTTKLCESCGNYELFDVNELGRICWRCTSNNPRKKIIRDRKRTIKARSYKRRKPGGIYRVVRLISRKKKDVKK